MGSWALEWASIRDGCLSQAAGVREGFLDRGGGEGTPEQSPEVESMVVRRTVSSPQ